ncbi:lipocalin/fatty-acid binding family protein [Streptomyces sp. cmx-4-9]|uniref:lipocalin/fatty-acid binding family protein n=1 Tax=Streptomyces sp. cmx-4-9 TaxID=2790941 RepID=UPI00397F5BF7
MTDHDAAPALAAKAAGSWRMVSSENFDAYLRAVGVGAPARTTATTTDPVQTFSYEDGLWTLETVTGLRNTVDEFRLGQEFALATPDGRTATSLVTADGDRLVEVRSIDGGTATIVREFSPGELVVTYSAQGVSAVRVFTKV